MNSLNSLAKLLSSSIRSQVVLTRHFSIVKQTPTKSTIKLNNTTILHQNSTKIPNGFFKITLIRSTIGLPSELRRVVRALGLHRLQQTVYHSQTPYIAGMILKVKEILQVNNVKRIPAPEERRKGAEKGYVIIKKT